MEPVSYRILSLDVGHKKIGVALSDIMGLGGQALKTIQRNVLFQELDEILQLCEAYSVNQIVIGLPTLPSGKETKSTYTAREIANKLKKKTRIPIAFVDEFRTTKEADQDLIDLKLSRDKRREKRDSVAALKILQRFLEQQ